MNYIKITIWTSEQGLEIVGSALIEAGLTDFEIIDPATVREMLWNTDPTEYVEPSDVADELAAVPHIVIYSDEETLQDGVLNEVCVTAAEDGISAALARVKQFADNGAYGDIDLGTLEVTREKVCDADWIDKWKEHYLPQQVGRHVWVRASWTDFTPPEDDIVIAIDPGMSFGTGTHETTFMTLRLMEKYLKPGAKVLDVGCGTGILSIAAAKMGAQEVVAIDIDDNAVSITADNAAYNNVEKLLRVEKRDLTDGLDYTADIITANLLTELVIKLSGSVANHLAEDGTFIASGILTEHEERVRMRLESLGFAVTEVLRENEWCAIAAKLTV